MSFTDEVSKSNSEPIILITFEFDSGDRNYAKTDIVGTVNDTFWDGRLISIGSSLTRELSDRRGAYSIGGTTIVLDNSDADISNLYYSEGEAMFIRNRKVTMKLGYWGLPLSEFQTIFEGIIDNLTYNQLLANYEVVDNSVKYFDRVPATLLDPDDWEYLDESDWFAPANIIYGEVTGDEGPVKLIKLAMDAGTKQVKYIVAGHHCLDGSGILYVDGKQVDPTQQYYSDTYEYDDAGVTKIGTRTISYSFDYSYTVSGKNYTVLTTSTWLDPQYDPTTDQPEDQYVDILEDKLVSCSISGITDDGTSSGTLLTEVVECFEDFLTSIIGIPSALIDSTSFTRIDTLLKQRHQKFAGCIVGERQTTDIIEEICMSHNIDFFLTRSGKFAIDSFSPAVTDGTEELFKDEVDILQDSFEVNVGMTELVNRIKYKCKYDWAREEWGYSNAQRAEDSITALDGQIYDWPAGDGFLGMRWNRDLATAGYIAGRQLYKFRKGRLTASFATTLKILEKDLTDKIRITHFDAPPGAEEVQNSNSGWFEHLCRISSMVIDADDLRIEVVVDNLQDLSHNCFFFGDRDTYTLAWTSATADEKRRGYLCDRATGEFSNGDEGKRLC